MPLSGPERARGPLFAAVLVVLCTAVYLAATGPAPASRRSLALPPSAAAPVAAPVPATFGAVAADVEVGRIAEQAVAAAEDAGDPDIELGAAVLDRHTGELALGERGDEPFYTASLSKLVVAIDLLDRRRLEGLVATAEDLDLLRRALGPSDDQAMNRLWVEFDGPGAASRVGDRLGLTGTSPPEDTGQWGEMLVSAADWMRVWTYVLDEMPEADRAVLVDAVAAAPATATDGFDQAFGLLSPSVDGPSGPGAVAKQGWMCCFSGVYYLNSAGAVGTEQRFVVALLSRIPRERGWDAARRDLTGVTEALTAALSR